MIPRKSNVTAATYRRRARLEYAKADVCLARARDAKAKYLTGTSPTLDAWAVAHVRENVILARSYARSARYSLRSAKWAAAMARGGR